MQLSSKTLYFAQVNSDILQLTIQASSAPIPMSIPALVPYQPLKFQDFKVKLESGLRIRNYQLELAEPGIEGRNYIFVAPTGSGKTVVAALVIANHLQKHQQNCHVVFIVDTKPLADQQKDKLRALIPEAKINVYTGDSPATVAESIKENHISVCTAGKLLDEIRKGIVKFSQLSLIVLDECHHARKNHPYAELMKCYLVERQKEELCIQIVGLTASPGAGQNPYLIESKTIDHLLMLAALLDAMDGIKTIVKNTAELEQYQKTPSFTSKFLNSRDHKSDPFINEVTVLMKEIEGYFEEDMKLCKHDRWSQQYETKVQQILGPLELSPFEEFRDSISALKQLRNYSTALSVYMDLRSNDAIQVIEEFSVIPEDVAKATDNEIVLKQKKDSMLSRLKYLEPKENPQLHGIETILREKFTQEKKSCAIIFVRTRKHAFAMKDWISNHQELKALNVTPDIITGHTLDTGNGMSQSQQKEVMKQFHDGKINLLIATSVAEEGLDIPACNLIIRYLYVSNEIAKVQTIGRARAENSNGYTILSSSSRMKYQEMRNEGLIMLMKNILENQYFPTGKDLREQITRLQRGIIQDKMMKAWLNVEKKMMYEASSVKLLCKKCKTFACMGSDVSNIQNHYVVHMPEFRKKFVAKPHSKPRYFTSNMFKIHKIYCLECEYDWGVECILLKGEHLFPVIKCKSFIFIDMNRHSIPVKKWSNVPFEVEPLSSIIKLESESDSESS